MDDHALNILLVDDDEIDVMTVKRAFAKANITNKLFIATDGVQALEMLRGGEVPAGRRLMLLDLNMPRMSGIELLREIRSDPVLHAMTVIACSAGSARSSRSSSMPFIRGMLRSSNTSRRDAGMPSPRSRCSASMPSVAM